MKKHLLLMDKEGTIKDYKKMEKLEAENKRLREALEKISTRDISVTHPYTWSTYSPSKFLKEKINIADQAIKDK
ncbi:hypothetical protein LCGC14_2845750 [marine sediment metagenome]|uniref:Uncharacterized protein n=1 Tax=marine sediment metagenome TaxID=412755 RepID=A0A0F8Y9Y5_9ZZZZ